MGLNQGYKNQTGPVGSTGWTGNRTNIRSRWPWKPGTKLENRWKIGKPRKNQQLSGFPRLDRFA